MIKRIMHIGLLSLLTQINLHGQISICTEVVDVQVIAMSPQSGSHNYFGIKVILNKAYDSDVVVKGVIYDSENSTGLPFELTVSEGYCEEQTAYNFYEA